MKNFYRNIGKRLFDVSLSFSLLLVTIPFFPIISLILFFTGHKRILYIQKRPGRYGISFSLLKFQTMTDKKDANGNLLPDELRLTKFGSLLRKTSLDELPQLLNVIWGNMSLVGPRPLLMEYLTRYTPIQLKRHNVKPGVTGWAQVNGRNAISWDAKFKYDIWYVSNYSFYIDMKILLLTLKKIIRPTGISYNGHATMPVFKGKEN